MQGLDDVRDLEDIFINRTDSLQREYAASRMSAVTLTPKCPFHGVFVSVLRGCGLLLRGIIPRFIMHGLTLRRTLQCQSHGRRKG